MKSIYISVINDIITDERVNKIARTLLQANTKIIFIGRKLQKSYPNDTHPLIKTHRFKLVINKGPLFYACFNLRLFFYLLFKKTDILVSNDLDTLLPNYLVAKIKNIPLVYDSHEYFPEVPELQNREMVKKIWVMLEKLILPRLKYAMTVSPPISRIYQQNYGIQMEVVRNLPPYIPAQQINADKPGSYPCKTIIYRGALNKGRGLEYMIKAMNHLDHYQFIIIGEGDITTQLKELAQSTLHPEKIIFTGKVHHQELFSYTIKADIGISIEEDMGLNYRYALPNKFFNYIQSRIPVMVSNLPEMAGIVLQYQIGEVIDNYEPQKMANTIKKIINKKQQGFYEENLEKAANIFCWENEEPIVKNIYTNAGLSFKQD